MKKVLVLGAGEMQVPLIAECRRLGLYIIAADVDHCAPGLRLADERVLESTVNCDVMLATARSRKIDAVVTTSDLPVRVLAKICKELSLAGPTESAANVCTDKYEQRKLFTAANLPTPKYLLLEDGCSAVRALEVPLPFVVKPVDSSASRGVSLVAELSEYEDAVVYARANSRSKRIIIESFVTGPEYSVEVLVQGHKPIIVAITQKSTTGDAGRFFVEERHIVPACLPVESEEAIRRAVTEAVFAVGLNDAGAHVELKLTKDGPIIIEMAARLGGDYITSDLVPLALGVNMLEAVIKIALGEHISICQQHRKVAGIQFLLPQHLKDIEYLVRKLSNRTGVVKVDIRERQSGNVVRSSLDRVGYYIGVADTYEGLDRIINILT